MNRLKLTALLTLALLLSSIASVSAQTQGPVYIVQSGDTLTSIARTFGTTVDDLIAMNGIQDPSVLLPGTRLIIPGYEGVQGVLTTRRIEYGETLESLSLRYGIAQDDLVRLNRIVHADRLYAGQQLILTERENDGNPYATASLSLSNPGRGKLEMAVRAGVNPWSLQSFGDDAFWVVPGSVLVAAGGDRPVSALPDPLVSVEVDPLSIAQGHTLVVRIELDRPGWVDGRFSEHALHFFPEGDRAMVSLQGVHAMTEAGLYDLEISLYTSLGEMPAYSYRQPIRVVDGGYGFEYINGVPEETVDPAVINPEQEMVETLLSPASPDRMWEGPFLLPSDYYTEEFLSIFGTRRSYNWGALYYYHTGLDFYGGTGVEIMAPARGKVIFAGPLTMRGNATYIDHGWGVYSGYFHQSEILVSEGEIVEPEQVIGIVGGTGRSTGPHLHWEVWVGGVPVDPLDWVQDEFP